MQFTTIFHSALCSALLVSAGTDIDESDIMGCKDVPQCWNVVHKAISCKKATKTSGNVFQHIKWKTCTCKIVQPDLQTCVACINRYFSHGNDILTLSDKCAKLK
ncbi:unnamed protein product [Cercospora beticola]|nr:unnamed protein product [Cercospora beticola]